MNINEVEKILKREQCNSLKIVVNYIFEGLLNWDEINCNNMNKKVYKPWWEYWMRVVHSPSRSASLIFIGMSTLSLSTLLSSGGTDAMHLTRIEPPRKCRLLKMNFSPKVTDTCPCLCNVWGYRTRDVGETIWNYSICKSFYWWNRQWR